MGCVLLDAAILSCGQLCKKLLAGLTALIDSLVYNIPAAFVPAYRGRNLIVRSHDPSEIVTGLADVDIDSVSYVQILSMDGEKDTLMRWGQTIPNTHQAYWLDFGYRQHYTMVRLAEQAETVSFIPLLSRFSGF